MTPAPRRDHAAALALTALGIFSVFAMVGPSLTREIIPTTQPAQVSATSFDRDGMWAPANSSSDGSLVTEGLAVAEGGDAEKLTGPQHLTSAYRWLDDNEALAEVRARELCASFLAPFRILVFPSRAPPQV